MLSMRLAAPHVRRIGAAIVLLVLSVALLAGCKNLLPAAQEAADSMASDAEAIGLTDVRSEASMQESPIPYISFSAAGVSSVDRGELADFMARVSEAKTPVGSFSLELKDDANVTRTVELWAREPISSSAIAWVITFAELAPEADVSIVHVGDGRARFDLDGRAEGLDASIEWGQDVLAAAPSISDGDDVDLEGSTIRTRDFHVGFAAAQAEIDDAIRLRDAVADVAGIGLEPELSFVGPSAAMDGRGKAIVRLDDATDASTADRVVAAVLELQLDAGDYDRRVFVGGTVAGESTAPAST